MQRWLRPLGFAGALAAAAPSSVGTAVPFHATDFALNPKRAYSLPTVLDVPRTLPARSTADSTFNEELDVLNEQRGLEVARYQKAFTQLSDDSTGVYDKATGTFHFFVPNDSAGKAKPWNADDIAQGTGINDPTFAKRFAKVVPSRGRFATRMKALEKLLEQETGIDFGYQKGHSEFLAPVTQYGSTASLIGDIYASYGVPRSLASHILAESGFNPTISSGAAKGMTQWGNMNRKAILAHIPRYDHRNFMLQAEMTAAALSVLQKRFDSPLIAASAYHTGLGNVARVIAHGELLVPDESAVKKYLAGADFTAGNARFDGSFKRASRDYPTLVVAFAPIYQGIVEDVEQHTLHRYRTDRRTSLPVLSEITGVSLDTLLKYNPHHTKQVLPSGTDLYSIDSIPHMAERPFLERTPAQQEVLERWKNYSPVTWNSAINDQLEAFAKEFIAVDMPQMALGIRLYGKTPVALEQTIAKKARDPFLRSAINSYRATELAVKP